MPFGTHSGADPATVSTRSRPARLLCASARSLRQLVRRAYQPAWGPILPLRDLPHPLEYLDHNLVLHRRPFLTALPASQNLACGGRLVGTGLDRLQRENRPATMGLDRFRGVGRRLAPLSVSLRLGDGRDRPLPPGSAVDTHEPGSVGLVFRDLADRRRDRRRPGRLRLQGLAGRSGGLQGRFGGDLNRCFLPAQPDLWPGDGGPSFVTLEGSLP